MGRSIAVFLTEPVCEGDFMTLVAEVGGRVTDDADLELGFSAGGGAHVWIYAARSALSGRFEAPTDEQLDALDVPPKVGLYLQLSHEAESGPVALRLCLSMLKRWRGLAFAAVAGVHDPSEMVALANASVVGNCLSVWLPHEPMLDPALKAFEAMTIDATLAPSAELALRGVPCFDFESKRDIALAVIAVIHDQEVWVVKRGARAGSVSPFDEYVQRRVEAALDSNPHELHLAVRRAPDSVETDRTAIRLATALVERYGGLVAGAFHRALDAEQIRRILEGEARYLVI